MAELVNEYVGTDDSLVIHNNFSRKLGGVADDQTATELSVMSYVNGLHQ